LEVELEPIIEINKLSFSYPDGKQALQDICLAVTPGDKIALLGANGAGKSTLLLHLNGILAGSGSVRIGSLPVNKKNLRSIRAFVGLVFQNPDDQLFSSTVFEDVAFGPIHQGLDEITVKQKVELALHSVHMSDYADRIPYRLSSGEKKRIAIATVLSMQPQILVLDEPSAGLDPRARRELIELLQELPQTMLIATHDFDLAHRLTTRTLLLSHGQIVKDGSTAEVLADVRTLDGCGLV
jgi:cobalt/nickel transport system ATP-binding protein